MGMYHIQKYENMKIFSSKIIRIPQNTKQISLEISNFYCFTDIRIFYYVLIVLFKKKCENHANVLTNIIPY